MRSVQVKVRLTGREAARVDEAAAAAGLSRGAWLGQVVLDALDGGAAVDSRGVVGELVRLRVALKTGGATDAVVARIDVVTSAVLAEQAGRR